MEESINVLEGEHCPYCAHSCLLAEASCRRGQTYAGELYYSRINSPDFMKSFLEEMKEMSLEKAEN